MDYSDTSLIEQAKATCAHTEQLIARSVELCAWSKVLAATAVSLCKPVPKTSAANNVEEPDR